MFTYTAVQAEKQRVRSDAIGIPTANGQTAIVGAGNGDSGEAPTVLVAATQWPRLHKITAFD